MRCIEQKDCTLYTVQLGSMKGAFERFLIQKLIRYTPATEDELSRAGLLSDSIHLPEVEP